MELNWSSLVDELKNGNNQGLTIFYREYSGYCINRLVKQNKCSMEDAEDIFIEAVMNLREKLVGGQLDRVMNVKSYLYKTCHNMFLVRLDQQSRFREKLSDIERFYYQSNHQEKYERFDAHLMEATKEAWSNLSERCKDIIHYFYVDNLSMSEIAELMDLSDRNVAKTTKSRCYKKFVEMALELKTIKESSVDK